MPPNGHDTNRPTDCCDEIAIKTTSFTNRDFKPHVSVYDGKKSAPPDDFISYSLHGYHPCGIRKWDISAVSYPDLTDTKQSSPVIGALTPVPSDSRTAPQLPWNDIPPTELCKRGGSGEVFRIPTKLLPTNVLVKIFFVATDCCDGNTGQDEVEVTLIG